MSFGLSVHEAQAIAEQSRRFIHARAPKGMVLDVGVALRGYPRELCIVAHTRRPADADLLRSMLPRTHAGLGVVVECAPVQPIAWWMYDWLLWTIARRPPSRARLGQPGSGVWADDVSKAGTLGCYVVDQETEYVCAITAGHVLSNNGQQLQAGKHVSSFLRRKGGRGPQPSKERKLGWIVHAGAPRPGPSLDVGLVKVNPLVATDVVPGIGHLAAEPMDLARLTIGVAVAKFGAFSDYSLGELTGVRLGKAGSASLLEITPSFMPEFDKTYREISFCQPGDSGSLVALHVKRKANVPAVGLLVAQSTRVLNRGYMLPLQTVLNRLNLKLWPAGIDPSGRKRRDQER